MTAISTKEAIFTSLKMFLSTCVRRPRHVITIVVVFLVVITLTTLTFKLPVFKNMNHLRWIFTRKQAFQEEVRNTQPSGTTIGDSAEDIARMFRMRGETFRRVCRKYKETKGQEVPGSVRRPFLYPPANFSVCGVPKVGVTFWKRVFFFLYHKIGNVQRKTGTVTSPFDIDRFYVHTHGIGSQARVDTKKPEVLRRLLTTQRVMFTRDPWSRLWSAYVDKYIFPDSWMDYGKKIIAMRYSLQERHAAQLRKRSDVENLVSQSEISPRTYNTSDKLKCPDDITFAEFLFFALYKNHNAHWTPVHQVCNPCVYDPIYLGKMETFSRDTAFILNATGLKGILDLHNHSGHVMDELEQLTAYHYAHFRARKKDYRVCLDNLGVARRLWRGFQLNGYIPAHVKFPEKMLSRQLLNVSEDRAQERFIKHVKLVYSAEALNHTEWSALKRRILVSAFRSVPRKLLYRLQDVFQLDFDLFQYNKQPADIFGTK